MKKTYCLFIITLFFFGCTNNSQLQDPIPKHYSFTIESKYVSETRLINVWAPPEYTNSSIALPVLYMPDGGIKEDFPHIANTLAKLIDNKSIAPIILVGIENTERGRDLTGASQVEDDAKYCPITDGAKNFRKFISQELFTEINKRYRTTNKKGIIGESLSGLFVIETLMLKPETFDFYIAMDPSLWWNNHSLVSNANKHLQNIQNKDIKLWFAGSNAEDISIYTNDLAKFLKVNTPKSMTWKFSNEPQEQHHTIFRATKEKALIWSLLNVK